MTPAALPGVALGAFRATRRYGDVAALRGVTFNVPVGQFAAVIGPPGAGKSTLMRLLAGLDRPTTGSVIVAGPDVLLADDPVGELDSVARVELLALMRDAVDLHGRTAVLVTGDPEAASVADRVIQLCDGVIVNDFEPLSELHVLAAMSEVAPG